MVGFVWRVWRRIFWILGELVKGGGGWKGGWERGEDEFGDMIFLD